MAPALFGFQNMTNIPDWVKVKFAAIAGISAPWVVSLSDKVGPVLDVAIKCGQVGVAIVTILYIFAKWRKVKQSKRE